MKSKIIDFIFGYEKSDADFKGSRVANAEKRFADKVISGIGATYTKRIVDSAFVKIIGKITGAFARTALNAYGAMLLSFGLLTVLINFASGYFSNFKSTPVIDIIIGGIAVIFAIPLLFFDTPLCEATSKSWFTHSLLHEILCIKKASRSTGDSEGVHPALCILLGVLPAISSIFLPVYTVVIPILILVHAVLAVYSPEYSFMITLLSLPFIPLSSHAGIILAAEVGLTTVSFLLKVALGKRMYHFEQYDALLIMLSLFVLLSGIFNKGLNSFASALIMVTLSLGYFLASNLIVNRRLADNAVNMILISSVPTAVYGIIYYFVMPNHPEWIDSSFDGQISSRAASTFGNPNIYAVFLIVVLVFSLIYALDKKRGSARAGYLAVFIINTVLTVLTWTRGAWLALLLSIGAYLILHLKKMPKALLIPLSLIPLGICFIPETVVNRFLSAFNMADSSISVRLSTWRSSLLMLKDNLFIGVGIGEESFREEFLKYAEDAVTSPHSHNLFLEIACQAGIFALLIFCFILLVRIRHIASYRPYISGSSITSPINMTGVCIFALITYGMTDYIFYNSIMYFLFWTVFGIGSACLRISRTEHDENLAHWRHTSMKNASSADIRIESSAKSGK